MLWKAEGIFVLDINFLNISLEMSFYDLKQITVFTLQSCRVAENLTEVSAGCCPSWYRPSTGPGTLPTARARSLLTQRAHGEPTSTRGATFFWYVHFKCLLNLTWWSESVTTHTTDVTDFSVNFIFCHPLYTKYSIFWYILSIYKNTQRYPKSNPLCKLQLGAC